LGAIAFNPIGQDDPALMIDLARRGTEVGRNIDVFAEDFSVTLPQEAQITPPNDVDMVGGAKIRKVCRGSDGKVLAYADVSFSLNAGTDGPGILDGTLGMADNLIVAGVDIVFNTDPMINWFATPPHVPTMSQWGYNATAFAAGCGGRGDVAAPIVRTGVGRSALGAPPHRFAYTVGFGRGPTLGGLFKHDLRDAKPELHDEGPARRFLEPVFVPRAPDADEDDGWILAYLHNAAIDKTDVVILHAHDVTGPPVATIHLPVRVPFGFRGSFVPDAAMP
jgi:hypothetical protein